jgi:hypothetical protein
MVAFSLNQARGAEGTTELATPAKQLFADDFVRAEMAPKWHVGKGFFTVKDGVVSIAENPDDHHGAYAYVSPNFLYRDVIAEFSVRLEGARSCSLMMNDTTYKESHAGHILKATVSPGKVNLSDWKYGAMKLSIYDKMKDPNTSAEEKKKLRESIKDTTADFKTEVDFSQWHVVRVEIVGDEMLMTIDGKPAAYLKSEGVKHPSKNAIGFEVGGKVVQVKNVKVWDAVASPEWSAQRESVIASLQK